MRIFLHPGMPKSGSTSIQWVGLSNWEVLAREYGVYYAPISRGELNDAILYTLLVDGDRGALESLALGTIDAATTAGCDRVVFSAERLFTSLQDEKSALVLLDVFEKCLDAPVTTVTVLRDLRSFLRSYIIQLMNNGGVSLDDTRLASWTIKCAQLLHDRQGCSILISYPLASANGTLTDTFFSAVAGRPVDLPTRRENVTSSRPLSLAPIIGCASKLAGLVLDKDVNSVEIDALRQEFEAKYDVLASDPSFGSSVSSAFSELSFTIENALSQYIESCLAEAHPTEINWYKERLDCLISTNLAKSEIIVGESGKGRDH